MITDFGWNAGMGRRKPKSCAGDIFNGDGSSGGAITCCDIPAAVAGRCAAAGAGGGAPGPPDTVLCTAASVASVGKMRQNEYRRSFRRGVVKAFLPAICTHHDDRAYVRQLDLHPRVDDTNRNRGDSLRLADRAAVGDVPATAGRIKQS